MEFWFGWCGQRNNVFYIVVFCILVGLDRLDRVCISGTEWCNFELLKIQFILVILCKQRRCQGVLAHALSVFYSVGMLTLWTLKCSPGDSFAPPWAVQPSWCSWQEWFSFYTESSWETVEVLQHICMFRVLVRKRKYKSYMRGK